MIVYFLCLRNKTLPLRDPIHYRFQNFNFVAIILYGSCCSIWLPAKCISRSLFLSLSLSLFPFEIVLIWNLNSAPGDYNKELQIKYGRKITALVKVKNALHSITNEQRSSIRWVLEVGRGGGDLVESGSSSAETARSRDFWSEWGSLSWNEFQLRIIGKLASNPCSRSRKTLCQTGQYISLQLLGPSRL